MCLTLSQTKEANDYPGYFMVLRGSRVTPARSAAPWRVTDFPFVS